MTPLDRFIRAVHLRWIIIRMIERAGVGVLAGSLVAGVLLPILLWRNQSPWSTLLGCLALGAAGGLLLGWIRRPTRLAAAVEADRQLDQADLLGTAYALPETSASDEWSAAVRFDAERRCGTLSANGIVLRRLGSRAWGGIGLAAALLVTVGLMFSDPLATRAERDLRTGLNATRRGEATTKWPEYRSTQSSLTPREGSTGESDRLLQAMSERARDEGAVSQNKRGSRNQSHGDAASGAGSAESDARQSMPVDASPATPARSDSAVSGITTSASGSERAPDRGAETIRGTVTPAPMHRQRLPWQDASWSTDRVAAEHAIREGSLPDAYSDVVREYFNPAER